MREKIIDKIRKLIAHERSARKIGNIAEAAAFAEKIQQLLIDHKLSMSSVTEGAERQNAGVAEEVHFATGERKKRARIRWEVARLARIVAEAHFCRALPLAGTNVIYIIGREEDRAVTLAMNQYLLATMRRLASNAFQIQKSQRRTVRNFHRSFYMGFLFAIKQRYEAMRAKADQVESTALILRKSDSEAENFMQDNHRVETKAVMHSRANGAALRSGIYHGDRVNLNVLPEDEGAPELLEER